MKHLKNEIIFRDTVYSSPLMMTALSAPAVIEACISMRVWKIFRAIGIVHLAAALLFFAMMILLRTFSIKINTKEIIFGFGFIRKRIALSKIREARIMEASFQTTGIGVRKAPYGYQAWTPRLGAAVRITLKDGAAAGYIISTGYPKDLVTTLDELTKSNSEPLANAEKSRK
jgi:hypothetical protein